ncbi:MAG: hypothetical protein VYA33_01460 [Pseudomonadota bacterium]|nr:hypothetical protein [Pseudomonadota bacterium]
MLLSIAAFLGSALAIGLFYRAWQSTQIAFKRIAKLSALLLMLASLSLWVTEYGPELGTCYAVVAFSLQAWSWIYLARQRISKDVKRVDLPFASGLTTPSTAIAFNALVKLLGSVFLSAVCAMLVTVVWTTALSMSKVNQIALGIYTMPLLWGFGAYWLCADSKLWRPVGVLSVLSALSYFYLYSI